MTNTGQRGGLGSFVFLGLSAVTLYLVALLVARAPAVSAPHQTHTWGMGGKQGSRNHVFLCVPGP